MGKVKQLWQDERDERAAKRIAELIKDGYSEEEAEQMAWDEQDEIDEANGQFGMGA